MTHCYKHVNTSVEELDVDKKFKLHLTLHKGGKKPLLIGMNFTYKDIYTAPSAQVSNYIRSVFRKFGNESLRKLAPNEYFSIEQHTIEKIEYKSLLCKFIENEKIYIDAVTAHAITQAWDHLMNQYDLSRLFSSRESLLITQGPNGLLQRYSESDKQAFTQKLPEVIEQFLVKIIDTERI